MPQKMWIAYHCPTCNGVNHIALDRTELHRDIRLPGPSHVPTRTLKYLNYRCSDSDGIRFKTLNLSWNIPASTNRSEASLSEHGTLTGATMKRATKLIAFAALIAASAFVLMLVRTPPAWGFHVPTLRLGFADASDIDFVIAFSPVTDTTSP